jgi:hypothetical protein
MAVRLVLRPPTSLDPDHPTACDYPVRDAHVKASEDKNRQNSVNVPFGSKALKHEFPTMMTHRPPLAGRCTASRERRIPLPPEHPAALADRGQLGFDLAAALDRQADRMRLGLTSHGSAYAS